MSLLVPGRYFTPHEARCHDGTPYPETWVESWERSRDLADLVRELWGGPLIAQSWYRTSAHNQALKERSDAAGRHQVASGSGHLIGLAIDLKTSRDIVVARRDVPRLHRVVLDAYDHDERMHALLGGVAAYPVSGWVHVDAVKAPDGHLRRWAGT